MRSGGARNCSAMPPSAKIPSARWPCVAAQVVRAAPALVTFEAAVDRLDDDGTPVAATAGQLVAEHVGAAEADVAQVGRADAGRLHVQQLARPRRLVELDDPDGAVATLDGLHDGAGRSPRKPMLFSTTDRQR